MTAGTRVRSLLVICVALISFASASAQTVTVSPTTLAFGNQVQGIASAVKTVTLKNGQSSAITVTSITSSLSDYTQTNTCPIAPATLGAAKTCIISVAFNPSALGSRPATLTIVDTGKSSPQSVALSGTGIAPVTATPTSISFPNQIVGVKSVASKVTVKNNLTTALTISKIANVLSDYSLTMTCPNGGTLAAGATCTVSVFFDPTVAGVRTDTLTITTTSSVSPTVSLSGTGVLAASVNPASLTFANQTVGTTSTSQTVTFTNNQAAGFKITSVVATPSDYPIVNACPTTIAAGASCTVSVSFKPALTGLRTGTLTLTDKASNSPQTVTLSGTGTAATLVSLAVTPTNASITAGATQQYTATGTYTDGSTQNLTSSVAWTSSATGIASISSGGLATAKVAGSTSITATSGTISGSTNLTVAPATLTSIAVTPVNPSFAVGTTQALKATGTYSDGSTQDLTQTAAWKTTSTSIATVNIQGVASAVAVGSTSVTATSGAITGSTTLTVTPAALVSIAVTPAIPSIPLGTTQQFTATGTFTDGSTQDITTSAQWSSGSTSIATISNAAKSQGLATSVATGTTQLTATSSSISGSTTLTVSQATLASIALTPQSPSIALGTTQQFTATGTFTDGSTQDLTSTATWSSDRTSVATVNKQGLASSVANGSANISATSGSISASTPLTVTAAQLVSIAINPPSASIPAGTTQQFTATGTYTDGSTQDVTQTGHWTSSAASVATISNAAGSNGLATTLAAGSTVIGISSGSVSASASLTVVAAALVSIAISPTTPSIPLGTSQQFTALGTYTDGNTQDLTTVATWSSSNAGVAVVSNASGSNGLASSSGTGATSITATMGSISNSTTLTVAAAGLVSITVAPASASIPLGSTQQFSATGTYTDGSTQDLTGSATWTSDSQQVSISAGGLAVGVDVGGANIFAASGTIKGSAVVTVGPPALVSIAVSPNAASVAAGKTQQFTATGTYSDGSQVDVTSSVSWTSSLPRVATVNGSGLATSVAQGSTTITATSGSMSASATLSVTASVLVSVAVSPASASVADGNTQQFTATGTYSDNSTKDLTNSADWSSSAPGVATISGSGLATGAGVGNATITASSGGLSGNASLAVSQATLVSIAVTPANSSFALGTAQVLKATGTYTDGSTQDLTSTANWSTGDPTVATVDAKGNAQSVAIGNTTVSAAVDSVTGSTNLTVTPAALVSIAVTPAIPSLSLGVTLQFVATGTFTDGSAQDVTQTVQWSSDNTDVATISNKAKQIGLASSVGTGTANIAATSGSVSGSTTLTVTAAALVSITVGPANPLIALGTTQQFTATGTFTDGSMQDLTSTATWASGTRGTATINAAGLATSVGQGTANITATSGGVVGTDVLTVTEAQIIGLVINPQTAAVPQGATQQFSATATYSDSTTQDVTTSVHWTSDAANVSTISNAAGTQGLATTLAAGTTTIGASSGSVNATAVLTVNQAALVSIAITPQSPTIALGTSQQFIAAGTYTDGTTQDLTGLVTWSSSSNSVMVVSNATGTAGLGSSSGIGSATITATYGSVSSSTTVTVGQAGLVSIAITPANSSLPQGYTLQFTATGTYSDGSAQDLTQSATWSSSSQTVANISATGLATGTSAGATTISATSQSISSSTSLTVTPAVAISLSVSPLSPSIYVGAQQQFAATLFYSDGSSIDATNSVTWTSSMLGVASIGSNGVAAGLSSGSSTIQASWGGGALTAATLISIMSPSVTITPASASISISGTQQFSATIAGSSNQAVTWAVDGINGGNSSVGTISTGGLYMGSLMIGNHAITATSQANTSSKGTASLTIGSLVPIVNTFFGMHLHYATSAVPGSMEGAGRVWDSNAAQWPNLNQSNGTYTWLPLDAVLLDFKNAGINDALYTLWRVPTWASSVPTDTSCDYSNLGSKFYGSCDLPTDLSSDGTGTDLTWRNWVQHVAWHANGYNDNGVYDPSYLANHAKISYWEPCNECYRSPTLDPGYGTGGASVAYKGSYNQLVRMMQDARCIIIGNPNDPITALNTTCGQAGYPAIGIDPSAKMVMPSTSPIRVGANNPSYPQVTQNLLYCTCSGNSCSKSLSGCTSGSAGSAAVDVLSVHIYPSGYTPEQIPTQVGNVRAVLQPQDLAKSLWADEAGWGQNTAAAQIGFGDADMESAWLARLHLMIWASGISRAYWYEWDNTAYGTLWSPTSISGCTTPFTTGFICKAGIAYQQVHNWMLGSTLTNCSSVGTSWSCNLIQANGSPAQIVWDTSQSCSGGSCSTIPYSISPSFNTYKDLSGASFSVSGTAPVGIKPILLLTQ